MELPGQQQLRRRVDTQPVVCHNAKWQLVNQLPCLRVAVQAHKVRHGKPHAALFLEGVVEEKFFLKPEERAQGKSAPYAFKVRKITLLGNIAEELLTGFSMDITTLMLTQPFREGLVKTVKKHKGKIPLTIFLFDPITKYRIQFVSKKFQVAVSADFLRDLQAIGVSRYEVLRK